MTTLLDKLLDAGLDVHAHPNWVTRTNNNRDRVETVGILNHWDAIQGWPGDEKYLSNNRFGNTLYHMVIKQDGNVRLYSQRYVWHAGSGDPQILSVAQNGGPIPDDSPSDPPSTNGNPHFFGVCINYHPNQGPVPEAQYDALVKVNRVLIDLYGLNVGQVARHMDWTVRKRDIDTIDLATFRDDISLSGTRRTDMQWGWPNAPHGLGSTNPSLPADIRGTQILLGREPTGSRGPSLANAIVAALPDGTVDANGDPYTADNLIDGTQWVDSIILAHLTRPTEPVDVDAKIAAHAANPDAHHE